MALTKKVIGLNSVDGARLLLDNEQAVRSKNASGVATDILKLDASNKLQLLVVPEVASDASSANQLVRKSQFDTGISGVSGSVSALEGEFDAFVATKAQPNGLASLDANGKLPSAQVPAIAITDVFVVANIAARDALGGIEEGDVAKVTDAGAGLPKTYIHDGTQWIEIESGSDVDTVNGYTGSVVLATSDVAESGVTNLYYTPTRQAAIEAYADQAELDAIASAASYTDGEITTLSAAAMLLDGSQAMTADMDLGSHKIKNLAAPSVSTDAARKGYVDGEISTLSAAAMLLSGSQAMTGDLNMGTHKIVNLVDPVNAQDAATKFYVQGQVSAEESARISGDAATLSSAQAYTDAQLDTLNVQQLGYEAKTLTSGEVSAREITLAASVVGTPWVMIDNVLLKPVTDFSVSGATISWPSDVPSLVGEELVEGDVLHVWYHKSATPFA